jgi:hypothetical protein
MLRCVQTVKAMRQFLTTKVTMGWPCILPVAFHTRTAIANYMHMELSLNKVQ